MRPKKHHISVNNTKIRSMARAHTETAVNTLASVMNKQDAPEASRVAAAVALLDRGWGKPKAEMVIAQDANVSIVDALARISEFQIKTAVLMATDTQS